MSVTCTTKRLETHLAFVTQTSAMALAREELEEGTENFSLCICFIFLVYLSFLIFRWVVTSGTARWSGSTLALTMICSLSILRIHC